MFIRYMETKIKQPAIHDNYQMRYAAKALQFQAHFIF